MKKNAIIIIFACFCLFSTTGPAFCDFDAFMKITGIPGESIDEGHAGWIEIKAYSWRLGGQSESFNAFAGRVRSARRPDVGPLTITKALDKASPKMIAYALAGIRIEEVVIELCRAEGNHSKFYEIKMENVIISHVFPHAESDSSETLPTESVDFDFGRVTVTYTEQNHATGGTAGEIEVVYDKSTNTVSY